MKDGSSLTQHRQEQVHRSSPLLAVDIFNEEKSLVNDYTATSVKDKILNRSCESNDVRCKD